MSFLTDDAYSEYRQYVQKFKTTKTSSSELAEAIEIINQLEVHVMASINASIKILQETGHPVTSTAEQLYSISPMSKKVSDFKKKVGAL
jgi:hypothetical protein